ncbi:MAG: RpiB/LacA/LacB family sugar-phosphate isomerase [Rickettsiales bacterium]|jgi:ribose 5-phosphate isomerase B|nr:RpiB/LacA/LacB family sugar-phosphate isomerase [Rickettsiales bacterium]
MTNSSISKIYIASDHRGVGLKLFLKDMLVSDGYDVDDLGSHNPEEMIDFPLVATWLADRMACDPESRGILICGHGAGVQIAANRFRHLRASRASNPTEARMDRFHDDINVLALSANDIDTDVALLVSKEFLEAPFDAIPRRIKRLEMIS